MATVVVLDDDRPLAALLANVVEESGREAIAVGALEDVPSTVEAAGVITDLIGVQAYDAAKAREWVRRVRDRFRGAPVIVVTGHVEALNERDALGADAVIGKPFDVATLLWTIERHMRKTP